MEPTVSRRELLGATALAVLPMGRKESALEAEEKQRKFQIGLVTYNVARDWNLPTIIKHCRDAKYGGVELRTTHAHGVEPSLSAERRKEVRQQFQEGGVRLWGLGSVCEFQSVDAKTVQENIETCKRFCELAKDVGAKGVKVRPNGLPKEVSVEKTLEQIGKALEVCGRAAQDVGVEIWLEVHGGGTAHPPHIKTIMEACNRANVGICWNSNPQDVVEGSVKPYFDLLKPWLKSCHINDLWGAYPYRELFSLMRESGYDGVTMCEVGTPVPAEAGGAFLQCYHGLWRELQRGATL